MKILMKTMAPGQLQRVHQPIGYMEQDCRLPQNQEKGLIGIQIHIMIMQIMHMQLLKVQLFQLQVLII